MTYLGGGFEPGTSIGADTSATKGTCMRFAVPFDLDRVSFVIDANNAADEYYAQVATVNPATGQIGTVLGTSETIVAGNTNPKMAFVTFSTPVPIAADTDYILVCVLNGASGTTNNRMGYCTSEIGYNIPCPDGGVQQASYNYGTIGLSDSQAASGGTSAGSTYVIFPYGFLTS